MGEGKGLYILILYLVYFTVLNLYKVVFFKTIKKDKTKNS